MVGGVLVLLLLLALVMVRVVEPSGLMGSVLVSWALTSRGGVGRACGLIGLLRLIFCLIPQHILFRHVI